ncbi:MAG TPA: NADH-quinone oxidoreductase subunit C [Haliangiales bacterium]|nr:NADH-quinone oxidoreductase subunit C [Haliangiales bacterium]
MSAKTLERLKERFGDAVVGTHSQHGDDTAVVARERVREVLSFLRDDPDLLYNFPSDLTCVDYYGREPRFEVVYHLYSLAKKQRVRVKCRVPEEDPTIDSVVSLYPAFNWFEREVWDMYGIKFNGHPDLRRLFMYESFQGHALRKDYPKDKRQPLVRREGQS